MGRPNIQAVDRQSRGTIQQFKDARGRKYWRVRVTTAEGERLWVGDRHYDAKRAREKVNEEGLKAAGNTLDQIAPAPPAPKTSGETCDAWHQRYMAYCKERGLSTVGDKGYRWTRYVSPVIGPKAAAAVTREDVETIRNALDDAIRVGSIKWKTAANAWGELSASLAEMVSSKRKGLQVLAVDPSNGVQAP